MKKYCPEMSYTSVSRDKKGNIIATDFIGTECLEYQCRKWIQVQGTHPQTGEHVSEYDCCHNWEVVISMDGNRHQIGTQAAVEGLRNQVSKTPPVQLIPHQKAIES